MFSEDVGQPKKSWQELIAAASAETDPEKLATMMEEIFEALEEREHPPSLSSNATGN